MTPYAHISYFKHFNAMRFAAAFLVLVHHAEQIRAKEGLANFKHWPVANFGHGAVLFFFVLSGFLITYLLLRERAESGTVRVGRFYQRRMVRIWPLYFLLVVLGLWVVPAAIHWVGYPYAMPYTAAEALPWFVFFMPFMVNILYGHSLLEPLWSIGVEELFYLGWGPVVKWLRRGIVWVLVGVVAAKYAFLGLVGAGWIDVSPLTLQIVQLLAFEAMAIGGLAAWWVLRTPRPIGERWWAAPAVQWAVLAFIAACVAVPGVLARTPQVLLLLAFAYVLVAVSVGERSVAGSKENRWLDRLGQISYGVYMYHMLVVFGVVLLLKPTLVAWPAAASTALFYALVVGGTLGVAWCSKRWFENLFLRLKKY